MKNQKMRFAIAATAMCATFCLPITANAQRHSGRNPISREKWEIHRFVDSAERDSNTFRHTYETRFEKNIHRHEELTKSIQSMDEAFERLRGEADDRHPWAGKEELRDVIQEAKEVNRLMSGRFNDRYNFKDQWSTVRSDINGLARIYGLSGISRK